MLWHEFEVPEWWEQTVTKDLIEEMSDSTETEYITEELLRCLGSTTKLHIPLVIHDIEWLFYSCQIEYGINEPPSESRFVLNCLRVMDQVDAYKKLSEESKQVIIHQLEDIGSTMDYLLNHNQHLCCLRRT